MKKKILIYGFKDKEKLNKIKNIADNLSIDIEELSDSDLSKTVGQLMNISNDEPSKFYKDQNVDTEFMLFSDFDREILQKFVLDLRDENILVPHKSVVTKHNQSWQLGYLVDHIMDEHQVMQVFTKLKSLMVEAKEKYRLSKDEKIKEAIDYAISLNEIADVKLEDIEDRYKKLQEAMNE